jgi:hypothetical protein
MVTTNDGPAAAAPSHGDATARDVACPLCAYDLRGLAEPRCPECGFRFEWADLLDPAKRKHPYLFEHHPERNVRSFVGTLWGGLRPRTFWTSLYPSQPSDARRLALYAIAVAAVPVLLPLVMFGRNVLWLNGYAESWILNYVAPYVPAGYSRLRVAWNTPPRPDEFLELLAFYVGWAAVTFLSLLVFRISMRRARIDPVHVARCVVYSFDAVFWVGALGVAAAAVSTLAGLMGYPGVEPVWVAVPIVATPPVLAAVVLYRLDTAYRRYLRFDRPFLTVLASQVITLLVVLNVLLFLETRNMTP